MYISYSVIHLAVDKQVIMSYKFTANYIFNIHITTSCHSAPILQNRKWLSVDIVDEIYLLYTHHNYLYIHYLKKWIADIL